MKQNQQTKGNCTSKSISQLDNIYCSPVPNSNLYVLNKPFKLGDFTIPKGYKWDGASIPRPLWFLVGPPFHPKFMRAALVHDFLYHRTDVNAACTDKTFLKLLLADGVPKYLAYIMYYSVRSYRIFK